MIDLNPISDKPIYKLKPLLFKYAIILLIAYIAALTAAPRLWAENVYLIHSIMEMVCVFIAVSTFLVIWSSNLKPFCKYQSLGYGFLAVAVFDSFHTYYLFAVNVLGQGYPHLSAKYWMISRLVEAMVLAVVVMKPKEIMINKWLGLISVLILSCGFSLAVLFYPDLIPAMMTIDGPTPAKLAMEYTVIALTIFSLYSMRKDLEGEEAVSYRHLFMGLLFIIPAELSFTLYKQITAFHNSFGHVLKIIFYYYFFRAVFVSCIEYPYKNLALACEELETTNDRIKQMDRVLNDTLDASPIGIMFYEHDGRIKYINRRLEELFACDRETLYGLTAEEFLKVIPTLEQAESVFKLTHESINDSINVIRTFRNMKGESIKLSLTSQKTKEGILVYFHEAKREQEMRNFHLQTQTILNAVTNSIVMVDKESKIILVNEAYKKLIELDDLDVIGMHINQLNDMTYFKEKDLAMYLLEGKNAEGPQEITITTLKGNKREVLLYASPIKNVDGEVIGAIGAATDITELKKNNLKVQQQEKLAMIGQMAAGIVHEIKNPLATIKGLSQLIKTRSKVDKVKEYAGVINAAIDDASHVVNEFLSFAKPKPTIKTRTSINRIVETMQLIAETQCYTKNIKSQFHYSSFPMEITADETKIKQVLLNLIENAITAMEGVESPELIVATFYNAEKKEGVVQVKDNGIGMSKDVLEKLGTPFYTTREKGTGLGLGICYQIMSDHYGRLEAQSEEGKGTTFEVIFTQIEDML